MPSNSRPQRDPKSTPTPLTLKSACTAEKEPLQSSTVQPIPPRRQATNPVDERKLVEAELRRERRFSAHLINSTIEGIYAFDRRCRYTVWNPAMEQIFGVQKSQVLGRVAFDVFPFLKETGEDKLFLEALAGRTAEAKNRPFQIPESGREGFFEGHYSPVRDLSGKAIGGIAIIHDITERKRAE